jgi:AcrR family transcriptional regulator
MATKRRRATPAEKQQQTRSDLMAAASSVFARRGYAGASVEEIAEEAGYSHSAAYSSFEGKADLFLAVYEKFVASRVKEIARTGSPSLDAERRSPIIGCADVAEDRGSFLLQVELVIHAARSPDFAERLSDGVVSLAERSQDPVGHSP